VSRSSSNGMPPDTGSHQNAKSTGVYSSHAQTCLSFLPSNAMENQACAQEQDVHVPGDSFDSYGFFPLKFPSSIDSGIVNRFKPIPTTSARKAVSSTPSEPSPTTTNLSSLNDNSSYSNSISRHGGAVHCCDNGVPDLLLGFDKHVAYKIKDTVEDMTDSFKARLIPEDSHFFAGAGCIGESPYITSRSFDELHRHLGIGLSSDMVPHLDLNQHQVSNANFIVPTASAVSKQGRLPAVGLLSHVPDFAQSQPPVYLPEFASSQPHANGFHQYPSCSSDLSNLD